MDRRESQRLYHRSHILMMKVAVAMVILRHKPKSMSAQSYTRQLAHQFQQDKVEWRKRAKQMEEELLRTRQDLMKCQGQIFTTKNPATEERLEQSDWQSQSCDMNWELSGVRVHPDHSGDHGNTNGEVGGADEGVTANGRSVEVEDKDLLSSLHLHILFLNSTSSVMSLHQKLPAVVRVELTSTMRDTLLQIIRGLKEALTDCIESSREVPGSAVSLVKAVSQLTDIILHPALECVRNEVTESLVGVARLLVCHDNRLLATQWCEDVLVVICCIQPVLQVVLRDLTSQLLSTIPLLTSHTPSLSPPTQPTVAPLRHAVGGVVRVEVVDALDCQSLILEKLLMKYEATHNIGTSECVTMASDLEACVREHALHFPLVVYSVWRLVALLRK